METIVETMETEENRRLAQQWLHDAKALIDPLFIMNGITPKPVNITRGFMENTRSGGKAKGKVIGQCHYSALDGVAQIYIDPREENVLHILAHELTHAYLPGHGHDVVFKKAAYSIGLIGKPTATVAGPDFTSDMEAIADILGEDPHSPLAESTKKKQGTRQIKCQCNVCGVPFRLTRMWIDLAGPENVICPLRCGEGDETTVTIG